MAAATDGKVRSRFQGKIRSLKVGIAMNKELRNKRLVLREARERAAEKTGVDIRRLEMAQREGLKLPTGEQKEDLDDIARDKLAKIIKSMVIPFEQKCALRDYIVKEMSQQDARCSVSCADIKANVRRRWVSVKLALSELKVALTLWTNSLKTIEGQFGGGVLMYFRFLRWLFIVNFVVFVLVFLFTVIPHATLSNELSPPNTTSAYLEGMVNCSELYVVKEPENAYSTQPVIDFLQGTGWMEKTIAFYGEYKDNRVIVKNTSHSYNLPLAYLLTVLACFLLNLVLVVRKAANGMREKLVGAESNQKPYFRLLFTIWDYRLTDEHNANLLCTNIYRELQCDLEEGRMVAERRNRSRLGSVGLWSLRVFLNVIVIAILAAACYGIYKVIIEGIKVKKNANFEEKTPFEQLSLSFMASLTITVLNIIVPIIFKKIVQWEKYSFAVEVNVTLFRTVFLKLASLVVLVYTIYQDVDCSEKDECNVGTGDCSKLRCWETRVGQEFYKLVLVDVFAVIAIVLFIEFPRRLVVTRVDWAIVKKIGLQEFDIPKNILDLIYTEVLVWFGMFFCPMLPLMTVLKLFLVFYLKMNSLLYNFTPSTKPYRASDSQFFVQVVLLGAYVVCILPIIYVMWSMSPSMGCGPFRSHEYMYEVMIKPIEEWPRDVKNFTSYIQSPAFGIPVFVMLAVIVYFMKKMMYTYKQMIEILRQQLAVEATNTKYKLQLEQNSPRSVTPSKPSESRWGDGGGAGDVANDFTGSGLPTVSEV